MSVEDKALVPSQRIEKRVKYIPPDGGWGWMVLLGTAITNIFNQSLLSLFSLLYGDHLIAMGHQTSGAAIVMSAMLFFTNLGGPVAGATLKLTSPRTVAVAGACFCTSGIFFSGFSTNIYHLILTYGVLLGMGLGFIQNSSFVAINSYFELKKSRAVGLANVGTGVGQTIMPHLVRYLLENYGFRGACLLLSGLSLHGIGGTLLIQPIEWHLKKVEEDVIVDEQFYLLQAKHKDIILNKDSVTKDDIYNGLRRSTEPSLNGQDKKSESTSQKFSSHNELTQNDLQENNIKGADVSPKKGILTKLYDLFDISLLSSPRFLNVIIGTALAVTSIQNFSMLFPLFLQQVAYMDKQGTANCMSAVALSDIAGRLILPIFQDKYRIKARWMLIMTSVWLIVVRQIMAYQTNHTALLILSGTYGFGRSMVIVARNIAISQQVRIEQVPAAVGLGMLTMGIIVPPTGYLLGWIRDYTDSFAASITAQNLLLVLLLITWIPDMLLMMAKEKQQKKKEIEQIQLS